MAGAPKVAPNEGALGSVLHEAFSRARDVFEEAQLRSHRGAARATRRNGGSCLRRSKARGATLALRLSTRARRRAEELGGSQGPQPSLRRQALGRRSRGPSGRLREVRRNASTL